VREVLQAIHQQEQLGAPPGAYTGRVGRTGGAKGVPDRWVVLQDVRAADGQPVTDHVWFPATHEFAPYTHGERVRFVAKVNPYFKGPSHARELDYAFSRPKEVMKAAMLQSGEPGYARLFAARLRNRLGQGDASTWAIEQEYKAAMEMNPDAQRKLNALEGSEGGCFADGVMEAAKELARAAGRDLVLPEDVVAAVRQTPKEASLYRAKILANQALAPHEMDGFHALLDRFTRLKARQQGFGPDTLIEGGYAHNPASKSNFVGFNVSHGEQAERGGGRFTVQHHVGDPTEGVTDWLATAEAHRGQGQAKRTAALMDDVMAAMGARRLVSRPQHPAVAKYRAQMGYKPGGNPFMGEAEKYVPDTPAVARDRARFKEAAEKAPTRDDWKTRPGVRAMVTDSDGKVLLLRRPDDEEFHPGTWNLPGGAKEDDETFLNGALRELKEETNLDAYPTSQAHEFKFPGGMGKAFMMSLRDGAKLKLDPREVDEAGWFYPDHLPKKLFPQTASTVKALLKLQASREKSAGFRPYEVYLGTYFHE
jgi:ADP-ribose pyrophosphatase YjhB (NUDIX family)